MSPVGRGTLSGITIVPRVNGEDIGDEELRWEPNHRHYIAGPVAWRVLMQIRELKLEHGGRK